MSNYKVGDVAALFSKPKEPTTETGKKLQSLFQEFHSKNKSAFHSQDASPVKKNKFKAQNEGNVDQKLSKKNKKRKFSAAFDQESSLNEEHKKVKFSDSQVVELKSRKKKDFSEEGNFPRKKKKASKLNAFDSLPDTFSNSEVNGSYENKIKSPDTSKLNNGPTAKKVKSGFIKKSKNWTSDANDYNYSENKIKPTGTSELNNNRIGKKVKPGSFKKSKHQTYDNNEGFDKSQTKKSKVRAEAFDSDDESFKEEIQKFITTNSKKLKKKNRNVASPQKASNDDSSLPVQNAVNKHSLTSSSFHNNPSDVNQVSDFVRRPKNQNKVNIKRRRNDEDSSNKKTFGNDDNTLFKSENEDYVKDTNKKYKKKFNEDFPRKSPHKPKPEFVKLLEKSPEDEEDKLGRTLFIGNLPVTTRLNELKDLFSPYGEISYIRFKGIETDKAKIYGENPSKSLNVNYAADSAPGFVIFKEKESAEKALALCGTVFKNRHITVDFAMPAGNHKIYDQKRSIFIGNLPFGVTDEDIWDAFSDCGKIEGVRVVRDKATGIGKGFGYVLFKTAESRNNALSLEDLKIGGRSIRIKATLAADANKKMQKKSDTTVGKKDTFKSRAIALRNKKQNSRKSLKKLVKREKDLRKKKKMASLLQKSSK